MRSILALVGAGTVAFLAVGWYLGWYQVSSKPNPAGKQSVSVDINPNKISEDVKKGVEKGGEFVDSIRDKSKDGTPNQAGPATNFFTPTSTEKDKGSSGGWKPIGNDAPKNSDPFGARVPRN